jgi:hypothetical protein
MKQRLRQKPFTNKELYLETIKKDYEKFKIRLDKNE